MRGFCLHAKKEEQTDSPNFTYIDVFPLKWLS